MSTTEKKVTLRFEVADGGAAQQLGKLADNASKAAAASKDLRSSINQPSGSWGGYSPLSGNPMGFPSMAGGYHGPNTGAGFNFAALASAAYRDPTAAFASMRSSGGAPAGPSGWDPRALAQAGFTPSSSGWNPAALAASARTQIDPHTGMKIDSYRVDSLRHARYTGTSDEMLQTMNQHRTDPGMLAAMGAGAHRFATGPGLRWGARVLVGAKVAGDLVGSAHAAELVEYQGGTTGEQARAFAQGSWITRNTLGAGVDISDFVRGRSQGMARVEYDQTRAKIALTGAEQQRQNNNEIRLQRMELEASAATLNRDGRMARISPTDRGTVAGERDYGRQLQLQPLMQREIDSQRGLATGTDILDRQERMRDELRRRSAKLQVEYGALNTQAEGAGGTERLQFLKQASDKNQQIKEAADELARLEQRIEKSRNDVIGLRAEVGQSRVNTLQGRLNILEQREGVAANQAQRIGRMSELDYQMNRQAAEQVQKYGLGVLPPEWEARAEAYAPQAVGKLYEERGIRRNRNAVGGQFAEFEDNLPDVRGKIDKDRNELADAIRDLKKDTANEMSKELLGQKFREAMSSLVAQQVSAEIQEFINQTRQGNVKK